VPSTLDPAVADELVGRVGAALRSVGFGTLPGVAAELAKRALPGARRPRVPVA
jgi:hypothetical protein